MRDLREFHDPDLYLPINGKRYRVKSPNAAEGLRLRALFADPTTRYTDDDQVAEIAKLFGAHWEADIVELPLVDPATGDLILDGAGNQKTIQADHGTWAGGVWGQMVADGVTWDEIMHAGTTAMLHYGAGASLAEIHWETGLGGPGNQLPPEPNRGTRSSNQAKRKQARRRNRNHKK